MSHIFSIFFQCLHCPNVDAMLSGPESGEKQIHKGQMGYK
jgi:hypothetical protein